MNKKIIIVSAAVSIGILLFVAIGVIPLLGGIKKNSQALESQYSKILNANSDEAEVVKYLKFSQAHKEDFEIIESIFVDAQTPVGFIQFIEEISATSNIIVKITPGIPKKQKGVPWPIMDFQLASSANYSAFFRFLEKLENGPYLLEVQNTSIIRDRTFVKEEENITENVSFTLRVQVFTGLLPEFL